MLTRKSILVSMTVLLIASTAGAADWPKWRGPNADGISTETNILTQWPEGGPAILWTVPAGDGYSSPIAYKGKIYIFSQQAKADTLVALDAKTGKPVWPARSYPTTWKGAGFPGTRATPAIDGGKIFTYGGAGDVACWNLKDGKLLWHVNVLNATGARPIKWGESSSPLVIGDRVFVQCGDGGPTAVGLDRKTGKIVWKSQSTSIGGYAPIVAADVDGRKQLLIFGGEDIVAADAKTGRTIWTLPHETNYKVNAATPIVHQGQALFTNEYRNGKTTMVKLSPNAMQIVWQTTDLRSKFVTPIREDDVVYMNSRGTLTCVRWPDGQILYKCGDKRLKLHTGGSFVRAGDMLITLSERGMLSLAKATPDAIEFRGQTQLFNEKNTWSTPLIYNGKLYVKGNKSLVCLDIAAK